MAKLLLGSVVGPQGPQGTAGADGAQGPQGIAGPSEITAATDVVGLTPGRLLYNNGGKVGSLEIVDNLLSIDPDKPLSAKQGKILDSAIGQNVSDLNALKAHVATQINSLAVVSILSYGGKGDGITDNAHAINMAIASLPNGGVIDFPPGTFVFNSSFSVPEKIILRGRGRESTILKRNFTGDFITSFGGKSGLEHLFIDGNVVNYGAGRGVVFTNPISPKSHMLLMTIKNFSEPCLEFLDNAGDSFVAIGCVFYTTGALNVVGAVKMGLDSDASSKHFVACESDGCTLFNFGDSGDIYVTGGFTNGLIFGTNSNKVMISNMRWGASNGSRIIINGYSHHICNVVSAVPVTVNGQHIKLDAEIPSYDIVDNGSNNDIKIKGNRTYICQWTGAITDPSLGNGTLLAIYNRNGSNVKVTISLTIGSTTTFGSGAWRFSIPTNEYTGIQQVCGSGITQNLNDGNIMFQVRLRTNEKKVDLFYHNGTTLDNIGATSKTWVAGSTLRFSFSYTTN